MSTEPIRLFIRPRWKRALRVPLMVWRFHRDGLSWRTATTLVYRLVIW